MIARHWVLKQICMDVNQGHQKFGSFAYPTIMEQKQPLSQVSLDYV